MAVDLPIPAELVDAPPLTDYDIDRLFSAAEDLAGEAAIDYSAALADLRAHSDAHPAARWLPGGDNEAEWAGRKLGEAQHRVKGLRQQADEWIARIEDWFVDNARRDLRTVQFMSDRLEEYAVTLRAFGGPATVNLPSVVVKTTDHKPKAEVVDDETVASYIELALEQVPPDASDVAVASRQAWLAALESTGGGVQDVVRRSAKVYVDPLRKLVTVKAVSEDVWDVTVHLSCGHSYSWTTSDENVETPDKGEATTCRSCDERVAVTHSIIERQTRLAVVGPDGIEVPGVGVKPGGITATVTPR